MCYAGVKYPVVAISLVDVREFPLFPKEHREISEKFKGMGTTLAKLEAFEAAVEHLSEMKSVADDQKRASGDWSTNATEDLSRAVDTFLETVDEILQEDIDDNNSPYS